MPKRPREEPNSGNDAAIVAQDACGGCGGVGPSGVAGKKRFLWWACTDCEQWYHSTCTGLTTVHITAIQRVIEAADLTHGSDTDAGPQWFCQFCNAASKNAALDRYLPRADRASVCAE